jgi:autotransporter adhesin
MAGALAGLPPEEPGKSVTLCAGVGNYGGYTALAIGGSARITDSTFVRMGRSATNGSRVLFNAAFRYS